MGTRIFAALAGRSHGSAAGVLLVVLSTSLLALSGTALVPAPAARAEAEEPPVLEYYGTESCPYCQAMQPFLDEIDEDHPGLVVARYDVSDPENAARWEEQMAARGEQAQGVPTAILGDEVWVGFNDQIAADIETTVAATPGVDTPVADASEPQQDAAPAQDGDSGPSVMAVAIGAAVVLLVAVALFAPRRSSGSTS